MPAETGPARWAAVAVIALGGVVASAWLADFAALTTVGVGEASMKFNTALCFVLCGLALLTAARAPRSFIFGAGAALAAGAIGLATLAEYLLRIDLGIDELVVRDTRTAAADVPGRMSAVTAVNFALFAAAALAARGRGRASTVTYTLAAVVGLAIAFLSLMGYAYGAPILYRPLPFTSIAFHTAIGFVALFVGVLSLRPDLGLVALLRRPDAGGTLTRRMLPIVLVLIPLLGCAVLQFSAAGFYGLHLALAIFAIATAAILTTVIWLFGRRASALEDSRIAQERMRAAVIQSALDAFVLVDSQGRIIEWNPQAERMFGWPRAEALGLTAAETIIPAAARDAHRRGLATFLATGRGAMVNRRNELTALRRNGEEFPAELIVTPIRVGGDWAFGGFIRDLSEQRQIESALRQSQKMEAVGQLTGGVAHDFNNLLTVVIGSLDSAAEHATGRVRASIEAALRAAERGATLTQRLLAFSRRQPLEPRSIDLDDLVRGMEDLLRRTLGAEIAIELRTADGLWPAFADRGQTENALLNLAVNARDAMPGGGRLTIETANAQLDDDYAAHNPGVAPGDYVLLAVTDTGAGMTPDVIERAFEPFFTTKESGKGTGLGLSMIYGFAKQSRGHVKIYSEAGLGTTVRLYLPRAAAEAGAAAAPDPSSEVPASGSESILVVDDDAGVRAIARSHLERLGYRVLEAADGAQARALLADPAIPIDLLFTDVVMPGGISGRELAVEARGLRPGLKLLLTSGYSKGALDRENRIEPGTPFVAKPYRRLDLAEKVRAALSSAAPGRR